MIIDGVIGSSCVDSSAEVLDINGADIDCVDEGTCLLVWEHQDPDVTGPSTLVGRVFFAKKIFGADDCSNDRERHYWDETKAPFIYGICRLFDEAGHKEATNLAAIIRDGVKNGELQVIRFSVEGHTLVREGQVLKETLVRRVAATVKPANRSSLAGILEDKGAPDGFKENPDETPKDELDSILKLVAADEKVKKYERLGAWGVGELSKATEAGSTAAAPSTLTGGSALQVEDRSLRRKKIHAMVRTAVNLPDGSDVRAFAKANMSEVSDEFYDHFERAVDGVRVKMGRRRLAKAVGVPGVDDENEFGRGTPPGDPRRTPEYAARVRGDPGALRPGQLLQIRNVVQESEPPTPGTIQHVHEAPSGRAYALTVRNEKTGDEHHFLRSNWTSTWNEIAGATPDDFARGEQHVNGRFPLGRTPAPAPWRFLYHVPPTPADTDIGDADPTRKSELAKAIPSSPAAPMSSSATARTVPTYGECKQGAEVATKIATKHNMHGSHLDARDWHRAASAAADREHLGPAVIGRHEQQASMHEQAALSIQKGTASRTGITAWTAKSEDLAKNQHPNDNVTAALMVLLANHGRYALTERALRHAVYRVTGRDPDASSGSGWTVGAARQRRNGMWDRQPDGSVKISDAGIQRLYQARGGPPPAEELLRYDATGLLPNSENYRVKPETADAKPVPGVAPGPGLPKPPPPGQDHPLRGRITADGRIIDADNPPVTKAERQPLTILGVEALAVEVGRLAVLMKAEGEATKPETPAKAKPPGACGFCNGGVTQTGDVCYSCKGSGRTKVEHPTLDADQHGVDALNDTDEQRALIHGLKLQPADPPEHALRGQGSENYWAVHPSGGHVIVKSAGLGSGTDIARHEAAYHNVARDFFGLGAHVPLTAAFFHPDNGRTYSVQRAVPDAEHDGLFENSGVDEYNQATLDRLQRDGTIHKLAIMNAVLGNSDRHAGNYLFSPHAPNLHLIDNGFAFTGAAGDISAPQYAMDAEGPHDPSVADPDYYASGNELHSAARSWLEQMEPADLRRRLESYGISNDRAYESETALRIMQSHLAVPDVSLGDLLRAGQDIPYVPEMNPEPLPEHMIPESKEVRNDANLRAWANAEKARAR